MKVHKDELVTAVSQANRRWLTGSAAASGNVATHWAARYKWSSGSISLLQHAAIPAMPARFKS